jgi:phosphohistidine phosphatase
VNQHLLIMKTLLLLRHAKSSWKEQGLSDHDRPLNKRGRRDAPRMGRLIEREKIHPDLIVTSTALRAHSTALAVADACRHHESIHELHDLYLAPPAVYIETAQCFADEWQRVLMVGHNPGISQFLWQLTGSEENFPTAALAEIELPISDWGELSQNTRGRLMRFWRPREL